MKHQSGLDRPLRIVAIAGIFLGAALILAAARSDAQDAAGPACIGCSVDGKTTPMKDGHPDLNGYWVGPGGNGEQFQRAADGSVLYDFSITQGQGGPACYDDSCQNPNQPSYTPAFLPRVKAIGKTEFGGTTSLDPVLSCKPGGVPRTQFIEGGGYQGVQIVQTPLVTAVLHGDYTDRVIHTDGRPHPADLEPSYMGDSIGHWEGNTLVVDVAGLNDDTWLGGGIGGPNIYTSIHSDKEHVVERWSRVGDELTYEATVDDPLALTKPWTIAPRKVHINRDPKKYLVVYYCDGSGIAQTMKEHYVKPNPEDRDIKYRCGGHHCDVPPAAAK